MIYEGFIGGAYKLRNVQASQQRTLNWYTEVIEVGRGKAGSKMQLVPTQGMKATNLTNLGGFSRGGYVAGNGSIYWLMGTNLYKITTDPDTAAWSTTLISSTIDIGTDDAFWCDNGILLFLVAANNGYTVDLVSNAVTLLNLQPGWAPASSMTYMQQVVVFSAKDTVNFFYTGVQDAVILALNQLNTGIANSDFITALINNSQDLWIFNTKSIEIWNYVGTTDFSFVPRSNLLIETGCASPKTIKKLDNAIFWLGQDEKGGPMLFMSNGYTPVRVSLHPIEQQWIKNSTAQQIIDAEAFVYQEGGHFFYVLNIAGQNTTWVYDLTSSRLTGEPQWHERQSRDSIGNLERHLAKGHVFANGFHIVGSYNDQTLYVYDSDTETDNGMAIVRERVSPPITNDMKNVRHDRLQLDFLTGATTNLSLNPQVMMQYSDDGYNWSDEWWESAGITGAYSTIIEFRGLGVSAFRIYRIRVSDGQYWSISGASTDVTPGMY